VAGPIAWKVTDMKTAGSSGANWHRFVLLLTETTGSEIEFWAIEKDVWYPSQTASVSTESGFWRLSASWGATNQIGVATLLLLGELSARNISNVEYRSGRTNRRRQRHSSSDSHSPAG
jgi:hypothetical protein